MTQNEIISLAREAGLSIRGHYDENGSTPQELERFATLVAAHEREACAKVCDEYDMDHIVGQQLAAAIRARGESRGSDE